MPVEPSETRRPGPRVMTANPAAIAPAGVGWPTLNWPLVICGYFAAQVVWRRLLGAGLNLDEAEILLWSRHLAWGYGPQPPLYSWLQWGFLQIVPDRLLALSLLKNIALATTYLAVWRLLRTAHPDRVAGPAALALFVVPQIAWDSQRDLTHSVLATALAALAALAFATGTLPGRRGGWATLGALTGFGLLAKPNFLIVPIALVLAAATLPDLRRRLSAAGLLLAAAIAAALVALPVRWALLHPELALASTAKFALAAPSPAAALAGLGSLALALMDALLLPALVLGGLLLFLRRRSAISRPAWTPLDRLVLRAVFIGLGLAMAGIVASGTTNVRPLWVLPAVLLAAPLAAARLVAATGPGGTRALLRTLAGFAPLVFVALVMTIRYGEPGNPALYRAPVPSIAADLEARFPGAERIVADPAWLAGSLIFHRPDLPVVSAEAPGPAPAPGAKVVAVWWDGDWRDRIAAGLSRAWGAPVRIAAPTRFSHPFPLQRGESFDVDAAEVAQ